MDDRLETQRALAEPVAPERYARRHRCVHPRGLIIATELGLGPRGSPRSCCGGRALPDARAAPSRPAGPTSWRCAMSALLVGYARCSTESTRSERGNCDWMKPTRVKFRTAISSPISPVTFPRYCRRRQRVSGQEDLGTVLRDTTGVINSDQRFRRWCSGQRSVRGVPL